MCVRDEIVLVISVISMLKVLVTTYWNRKWQPIPIFLPGKFHGQRDLAGYSLWDRKESDMTEYALAWWSSG